MELTHLDGNGKVKMVDVSQKESTKRVAVASGEIICSPETIRAIMEGNIRKGDVFACARIAGIMAAKKTSDIIILCHNINISSVDVSISADDEKIFIRSTVSCEGKTGVEMEALTAVSGACLCVYDMCKAIDKSMVINNIKLLEKSK